MKINAEIKADALRFRHLIATATNPLMDYSDGDVSLVDISWLLNAPQTVETIREAIDCDMAHRKNMHFSSN